MEIIPPTGRKLWSPTIIQAEAYRMSLRKFAKNAWPHFDPAPLIWNWHLDALCDHLSYVALGEIRFLLINMPPRTSKSSVTSVIFPVWEWLYDPTIQYLTGSYSLQLSTRDTLRSRRLIDSSWFQRRWGGEFRFAFDDKLKRQYSNDKGGRRIALAVESATTGEGGNRLIVDDPHNATEVESEPIRLGVHDWWDNALSSRMNNPDKDAWILNGQRTGEDDLFGHVIRTQDMSEIVHLVLPNEYNPASPCKTFLPGKKKVIFKDPRTKSGELLCEARVSAKATKRLKRTMRQKYNLQYQQDPKAGGGNILLRDDWRKWEGEPPEIDHLVSVYDTAFGEKQVNDYSARTDWGIFKHRPVHHDPVTNTTTVGKERNVIILLGAWRDKVPYSKLKAKARQHHLRVKPDWTLVEKKGSGIPLCQDLSRANVKGLRKVSLDHGGRTKLDKVERANISSDVLADGLVYYVERDWAEEVIDECAAFPKGTNDDYVDTCLMAWMFLKRMGEVHLWEEVQDDGTVRLFKKAKRSLYG